MRIVITLLSLCMLLISCAHTISIKPTDMNISKKNSFNFKAAYIISSSELNQEIITSAGGGDKVRYKPYEALDSAINLALKQIFLDAIRIESISQLPNYSEIGLVFDPTIIKTDSSSTSFMFWPPESFTIQLDCYVYDRQENKIQKLNSVGHGSSSRSDWFGQFDKFGIAGQRAMQDAVEKIFYQLNYDAIASLLDHSGSNNFKTSLTPPNAQPYTYSVVSKKSINNNRVGTKWAIIIGISQYQNAGKSGLMNLIFADDDAKSFVRSLQNLGWNESHIKLLTNKDASKRNIEIALESWLTKAGPNDQVILFWSGHGYPDPENQEKVYFATYDTDISIPATGYRMDKVRTALEEINAKNVILLADTCHAGKLITRGDGSRGISIVPDINKMARERKVPKGWIFMVGADTDRQAIEHTSWTNGAFTHSLIKGLNGEADGFQSAGAKDGVVTMGELKTYMNTAMPNETQKILGVAKRPVIATSTGNPDIWNLTMQITE